MDPKIIISSLTFGLIVLIFGIFIFKIFRIVNTNFNNDLLIGLLLIVSGALGYAAYDYLGLFGNKKQVKFTGTVNKV